MVLLRLVEVKMTRRVKAKKKTSLFIKILFLLVLIIGIVFAIQVKRSRYIDQAQIPDQIKSMVKNNPESYELIEDMDRINYSPEKIDISREMEEDVPLLIQWDPRWGLLDYNDSFLATDGCGPTSLAMVYLGLTKDQSMNPYRMGKYFEENGWAINGVGTAWKALEEGANWLGLKYNLVDGSESMMKYELDNGKLLIISVGKGDFTSTGHLMVIKGYEGSNFFINDPNSRTNSSKKWSYERLAPQIVQVWSYIN